MSARAAFGSRAVRGAMFVMAALHTLPAKKHLALFFAHPGAVEAWKGFGAVIAVALYLLPPRVHARVLARLWAHHRAPLAAAGWALAAAHLVPALDHLPRFVDAPSFADGWRGIGALTASLWFVAPVPLQARALARLRDAMNVDFALGGTVMHQVKVTALVVLGLALGGATGAIASRGERHEAPARLTAADAPAGELRVPRAAGAIAADGELDDRGWAGPIARTGAFTLRGAEARPYSDARFAWDDAALYVTLYAADEELRGGDPRDPARASADAFRLVLRGADGEERVVEASPTDFVASGGSRFASRVRVGRDADGTIDDDEDDDEEWLVELAIPLDALALRGAPGERLRASIERCDTVRPRPGPAGDPGGRRCASWGVERPMDLVLE